MMTDVIKEILKTGHLISPDALALVQKNPGILDSLDGGKIVITKALLEKPDKAGFKVVFECNPSQQETRVENIVEFYKNRFDILKPEIMKKLDSSSVVSIKNPGSIGADTVLIGMVRDQAEGGFVIDDGTGNIRIISEKPIIEDIVVAVKGRVSREGILAEQIVYPDVPINKTVKVGEGAALFAGENPIDNIEKLVAGKNVRYIFASADARKSIPKMKGVEAICLGDRKEGIAIPSSIKLGNGFLMTFFRNPGMSQSNTITHLRARHLDPKTYLEGDPLLLRDVPDVAVCIPGKDFFVNYKGTTLISPGKNSYLIDFSTREILEVK